jgi:hypothetical protein
MMSCISGYSTGDLFLQRRTRTRVEEACVPDVCEAGLIQASMQLGYKLVSRVFSVAV